MEKLKVSEVVVEGRYDAAHIRNLIRGTVIETGGFGIFSQKEKLALLRKLAAERGLVILTDSDGAGFVIRNFLKGAVPKDRQKHVYIPDIYGKERRKDRPSAEGKLGVEGIPLEVLRECLLRAGVGTERVEDREEPPITKAELYADGLSGGKNSEKKRRAFLQRAGLPENMTCNALLSCINVLYTREEYRKIVEDVKE